MISDRARGDNCVFDQQVNDYRHGRSYPIFRFDRGDFNGHMFPRDGIVIDGMAD
jgi:hypothetical protein